MKKYIILTISLILVLCTLTSCISYSQKARIGATLDDYAIPGGYYSDEHQIKVYDIETDKYGRMLVKIKVYASLGPEVFCIIQNRSDNSIFYYDNICYAWYEENEQRNQEIIADLKAVNDWGKEIDKSKCVKKPLHSSRNLLPDSLFYTSSNMEMIRHKFSKEYASSHNVYIEPCDRSAVGQELYLIGISNSAPDLSEEDWVKFYFAIVEEDGSYNKNTWLIEFDDIRQCNEPLAEIKLRNNWIPTT